MGFLGGGPFDFNGDGRTDIAEFMAGLQMTAASREEAIEMTGDDAFYEGDDKGEGKPHGENHRYNF